MNIYLHILTIVSFILLPRLVSIYQWYSGYVQFCDMATNYIILVGILSSNLLHFINIGDVHGTNNIGVFRKCVFLSSIIPAILMDVVCCIIYIFDCSHPNMGYLFISVNMASIAFNFLPNVLIYYTKYPVDTSLVA
jgi:hypothetical protein